mgnify:CR=1 FL=1
MMPYEYLKLTRAHTGDPWRGPGCQHEPMSSWQLLDLLRPDGWSLDYQISPNDNWASVLIVRRLRKESNS